MKTVCYLLLGVALLGSGCETLSARQRRQSETRLYSDIANMKVSVQRLEQRVDDMEAGREALYAQIADLRASHDRLSAQEQADLAAVESKLNTFEATQQRRHKELLAELSSRIATIMKSHASSAPAVRSESGYEHIVKPGETISEIAKAYGVTISVITKANSLKNPDDIRVGQTLFIPE